MKRALSLLRLRVPNSLLRSAAVCMVVSGLCLRSYFIHDEMQYARNGQVWRVSLAAGRIVMDNQSQQALERLVNLERRRQMAILMKHIPVAGTMPGWAARAYEQRQAAAAPILLKYMALMNAYHAPGNAPALHAIWIIGPTAALDAGWVAAFFWFYWRRRRRIRDRRCADCGYDLRATRDRCPECGVAIPAKVEAPG